MPKLLAGVNTSLKGIKLDKEKGRGVVGYYAPSPYVGISKNSQCRKSVSENWAYRKLGFRDYPFSAAR